MVKIYCNNHHRTNNNLCFECGELLGYSVSRLDKCPYGSSKPTCAKCTVHCYKPEMRTKIRKVMRYSGPRMLIKHPLITLKHFFDKYRKSGK